MKNVILAAVAAISLTAAIAPAASAAIGLPHNAYRTGPYDNTGRGPQQSGMQGGGG